MKKFINLFFITSLFLIGFTACEQQTEEPGGIPGMGDTPGELEIAEPFVAPEGVTIDVTGLDEIRIDNTAGTAKLKSVMWNFDNVYGCGGDYDDRTNDYVFWITVNIYVNNISNNEICTTIPEGTVFKVSDANAQNGITTEDITICVKPNTEYVCSLVLMCLNKGQNGSSENLFYEILGTTDSDVIKELLEYLKGKKIGIEWYWNCNESAGLKSANADGIETYMDIADHIQNAIWQLTNDGKKLTKEQIDYFKSLPDLD